jgi:hypothetical protein
VVVGHGSDGADLRDVQALGGLAGPEPAAAVRAASTHRDLGPT